MDRCSLGCGSSSLSATSVCVAASANKITSPLGSDGRHIYVDAVRSSVMRRTNPMDAANHPALLLFLSLAYVFRNGILQ
ncbi:hypothetical protein Tco_0406836 [Tanacetum coccineum]